MRSEGYIQPSSQSMTDNTIPKADLDKWSTANRDIWKLVRLTGIPVAQAKDIVIGKWDLDERGRFESWVSFYESEDDKKYKFSKHIDCDIDSVRAAGIVRAAELGSTSETFKNRILSARNARTVIDHIRAMNKSIAMVKTAADEDDRQSKMFMIIREVQEELSKKRLVRNLARVLSMDRDGMFPEVPQALAKLIESYGYATTRIQDVMGRLGLQISMSNKNEAKEEKDSLSKILAPKEVSKKEMPSVQSKTETTQHSVRPAPTTKPHQSETPEQQSSGNEVILPRVNNRGL